ncbi:hypothetical protein DM02DRAFT_164488 [Periconia macrospinosa]|uniref:Transmembrane protein n=1 Tax=Periconia macrospinosa TaxID=97972 RepID=A0A2V1DB45_9PLEO|nr:hypothetical protein DM02DRAFT_164488 [Periconia macrospinosa]
MPIISFPSATRAQSAERRFAATFFFLSFLFLKKRNAVEIGARRGGGGYTYLSRCLRPSEREKREKERTSDNLSVTRRYSPIFFSTSLLTYSLHFASLLPLFFFFL